MKYYPTDVEKWISAKYKSLSIQQPTDIDLDLIAKHFNIFLTHKPTRSIAFLNTRLKSINLDPNFSEEEQREIFFHELCHILRHVGYQSKTITKMMKELQEWDANRFMSYAAIPFHLLKGYDLKHPNVHREIARDFGVSPKLARLRVNRIIEQASEQSRIRGVL
ncbi:ImmA/IrrE family metallo-endopeptidase [Paenalkalicoccus suaedae]|uniref:ImmA/IrrE family metallo-endopeptidase n=1 Tax=Paenalkalicoccus suaedae TaxID=2592382 RepID=A0A859FCC8_9BACI|nr:ImmA/IrrE family metallo-endopeptidase [Paenalkalicoccus suaedae]QKS70214.1 ImmA/IrrE family metallo-endopeptidase [Paenalkalicoccus suaedae]